MDRRLCLALGALACACQTYDFLPVTPTTAAQTSIVVKVAHHDDINMMLVVDKSGSMDDKLDASCTSNCATRMTELKTAMSGFLGGSAAGWNLGLTTFPNVTTATCGTGGTRELDLPTPADQVNAKIQALVAGGGTPTASTLRALESYAPLAGAASGGFVLLLTDGLPNCNPNNPANPSTCACTGNACAAPGSCTALTCLDQDNTVAAISELKAKHISTFVIGFGADATCGAAPDTLDAMAVAGGYPRTCAGCRKFYAAANAADLASALDDITSKVSKPCEFTIDPQPTTDELLAVLIDGNAVAPGPNSWSYDRAAGKITFADAGAQCQALKASTSSKPVNVEIRIVQTL